MTIQTAILRVGAAFDLPGLIHHSDKGNPGCWLTPDQRLQGDIELIFLCKLGQLGAELTACRPVGVDPCGTGLIHDQHRCRSDGLLSLRDSRPQRRKRSFRRDPGPHLNSSISSFCTFVRSAKMRCYGHTRHDTNSVSTMTLATPSNDNISACAHASLRAKSDR